MADPMMPAIDTHNDVTWNTPFSGQVAAAKVHLLNLDPIRDQLGARWPRLSALVHKLFENALRRAQGPNDRFIAAGELCYLVTFDGLSQQAAMLACEGVAKTVCELLFGADHGEMRVRSLVGMVPAPVAADTPRQIDEFSLLLERVGRESVTSSHAALLETGADALDWARPPAGGWLAFLRQRTSTRGLVPVFLPLWELSLGLSQSLVATLTNEAGMEVQRARLLPDSEADALAEMEIALLLAAGDYAQRLASAGRICAVTTGISHQTFSNRRLRLRYLRALKGVPQSPICPLLVRLENIPAGMVTGRLAELVAMLSATGVRVILHFDHLVGLPRPGFRLGVAGMGATYTRECPPYALQRLIQACKEQKAFSFLCEISPSARQPLVEAGVKFGSGAALDGPWLSGWENVPALPLKAKWRSNDAHFTVSSSTGRNSYTTQAGAIA